MYIGEVSRRTGATPKAIRLYEELGLISAPKRRGKYRCFQETDVELIQVIKQAQRLGFTLAELKAMLDGETSCEDFPWEKAVGYVESKIETIMAEIGQLEKKKKELVAFAKILAEKDVANC
jgi:MerR family copper efflux transcriptional regulator